MIFPTGTPYNYDYYLLFLDENIHELWIIPHKRKPFMNHAIRRISEVYLNNCIKHWFWGFVQRFDKFDLGVYSGKNEMREYIGIYKPS